MHEYANSPIVGTRGLKRTFRLDLKSRKREDDRHLMKIFACGDEDGT